MEAEQIYESRPGAETTESWWAAYERGASSGMTPSAWTVVDSDSSLIAMEGVNGAGPAGGFGWPSTRVRTGLVVGAVQSGKTASMFGVMAKGLDSGVDMVVVLAGTRVALWQQTFERFTTQMEDGSESRFQRGKRRLLRPDGDGMTEQRPELMYAMPLAKLKFTLRERRPIVVFVMKHPAHLQALAKQIKQHLVPLLDRPFHMVVLDDEADDGSVLDARAEASEDPMLGNLKQTPRSIENLWRGAGKDTASQYLHATYVAYTATPQANILQEAYNPLAPRDFLFALRTPSDKGEVRPREATFREAGGLARYYTGGAAFYDRGDAAELCEPIDSDPEEAIPIAVRAYLVAGAIRLARSSATVGPASARAQRYESAEEAAAACGPHSMLLHPSSAVDVHFAAGEALLRWAGLSASDAAHEIRSKEARLPLALATQVEADESPWEHWYDSYTSSAQALAAEYDLPASASIPDWVTVKDLLVNEVIPGTRVAVINSREDADDRPQFLPRQAEDGSWRSPRDLATIFVSGNVMSRGLTLDGLTTTLFLRETAAPLADTQMQMQRWFGYRGRDLELCRVFLPTEQLSLFRRYHSADEALRRYILTQMNDSDAGVASPTILEGSDFVATGKIASLRHAPLAPGPKPMVRFTNRHEVVDDNVAHVAALFRDLDSHDVVVGGSTLGRILSEPLSLTAAADWLDGLSYPDYRPGRSSRTALHWEQVEAVAGNVPPNLSRFYRAPEPLPDRAPTDARSLCPYATAAYLRLWAVSLTRRIPGLVATDDPSMPWTMVDLDRKQREQPRFHVGIKYGTAAPVSSGELSRLRFSIRAMSREFAADSEWMKDGWGSRNPTPTPGSYFGDEYFDYHESGKVPAAGEVWRPAGSDGLILVHVLERKGTTDPVIALGMCVPAGGPDQFPALLASTPSSEGQS